MLLARHGHAFLRHRDVMHDEMQMVFPGDRGRTRHLGSGGQQGKHALGAGPGHRLLDLCQRTDMDHCFDLLCSILALRRPVGKSGFEPLPFLVLPRQAGAQHMRPVGEMPKQDAALAERRKQAGGIRQAEIAEQRRAAGDRHAEAAEQRVEPRGVLGQPASASRPASRHRQARGCHIRAPGRRPPMARIAPPAVRPSAHRPARSRAAGRPGQRTCRRNAARRCRPGRHRRPGFARAGRHP